MSDATLANLGISDLFLLLIVGGIILLIVIAAFFLWISKSLGTFLNGVDKKSHKQAVYQSIPELREIVRLYPDEKVGIEAGKILNQWDNEIKPSLKTMRQGEKERKLTSLYRGSIYPILQAYKQIVKP